MPDPHKIKIMYCLIRCYITECNTEQVKLCLSRLEQAKKRCFKFLATSQSLSAYICCAWLNERLAEF